MRLILVAALIFPVCMFGQGKKDIATFGKIDKADLLLTNCSFDPDAEAMILSESGEHYIDFRGQTVYEELERHVRIKILKDKGKEWANVKVRYHSFRNDEAILNLAANSYNLDASGNIITTKLDKKLVYQTKINSRISEQSFTLPDVKAGTVIEYKYTIRNGGSRSWTLQSSIPVLHSRYKIDCPSAIDLYVKPMCNLPFSSKDLSGGLRTIKAFSMDNIPALHEEEYITARKDYLQRIDCYATAITVEGRRYPLVKTWPEVVTALMDDEDFGKQLTKEIPRTVELDMKLKGISDDYMKMRAVHEYVRRNMAWDGVDNIWALNGVKSAWKEKSGTSGEINLILVNLLKDAGIKASPLMVSTRENGIISMAIPGSDNFNKVMAFVELQDRNFVLDGTDKFTPSSLIPESIMCTEGLVLDKSSESKFRWVQLWDSTRMDKNIILLSAVLNQNGEIDGRVTINSKEYARTKRAPFCKDQKNFLSRFYLASNPGVIIDSLEFGNEDNDSLPLTQSFVFKAPVTQSGDYSYFSGNLISGLKANPFVADSRSSDVFFGTNQNHVIIGNYSIPEGYEFEELPKNIRFTLEDKSVVVTRLVSATGNILNTKLTLEFKRPFYTPEEYPDLKEFYKKMYALLEEQIVIKKKHA